MLQFHGDETPEQCQEIAAQVGRRWYKAIQVKPGLDIQAEIQELSGCRGKCCAVRCLASRFKGGTGHSFDWTTFPKLNIPLILAGGLNPDNIEQAIAHHTSLCCGCEWRCRVRKRYKDQQLIERFMQGVLRGSANNVIDYTQFPDAKGHFGIHGGRFVSETLMAALEDLEKLYFRMKNDEQFLAEFDRDLAYYVGRPSPLYYAERWSKELGGAQIYLKREDLNHTGSHKINNTIGQALLAKLSGKKRIIAETGAGQHGVATATIAARFRSGMCGVHGR